jgi:hypothetical protein
MDRTGLEYTSNSPTNPAISETGVAQSGAAFGGLLAKYPDLAALVAAWPTLPAETRQRILKLVAKG